MKWHDFVKFKSDAEYGNFLSSFGFVDISSAFGKNTIIMKGKKSQA